MSDALPLPPRPNLDQYKKLAKDLQHACKSGDAAAVRAWASELVDRLARLQHTEITEDTREGLDRAVQRIEQRWNRFIESGDRRGRCLLADAQYFVAVEHGFTSWPKFAKHVEMLTRRESPISNFEAAADAIVAGDADALRTLLRKHPELARARSSREHRSTLLHYVSANGVEDFRQKTPPNIVEITRLLLDAGADVNAESEAYGGGSTTLGLTATSLHPEYAGVQIELLETLIAAGAWTEKPGQAGNQHGAVMGCLANGQGGAARFFAARGAHLDLEEAAGVGYLDVVKRYFDDSGNLAGGATRRQMESGFLYACGYGHADVVRFLLERGVDPGMRNDDSQTGLHWAAYGPHVEVVEVLIEAGAPVNVMDAHQRMPLDWAVGACVGAGTAEERQRGYEMVARLIRAGAKPDLQRLRPRIRERVETDERLAVALRGELP
jgi:hypothetical protein